DQRDCAKTACYRQHLTIQECIARLDRVDTVRPSPAGEERQDPGSRAKVHDYVPRVNDASDRTRVLIEPASRVGQTERVELKLSHSRASCYSPARDRSGV